jgi:hypothetical protein
MRRRRNTRLTRSKRTQRTPSRLARRSPSRPLRLVSFRSRRVRLVWACAGAAVLGASYLVARPTFEPVRPPPRPWRLWLSTDAKTPNSNKHSSPGWLLRLNTLADNRCSHTIVTGALEWSPREITDPVSPVPTRYVIAIAEAHAYQLETRSINPYNLPGTETWHKTPLHAVSGAKVAEVLVAHWQHPGQPAEFRLTLAASQSAGFESCYVTSPAIGDFYESGNADEGQPETTFSVSEFLEQRPHASANLQEPLYLDAISESEVPEQGPEDAATSALLTLHPRAAITSCTTLSTKPYSEELDPYREDLSARAARPCASVQLFRSSSLQATLTRHGYFSGLLATIGIAMLIEALMAGVTDPPPPPDGNAALGGPKPR